MSQDRRLRTIGIHVAAWVCFIAYEVAVAKSVGSTAGFRDFAPFYALNISLFYFNSEVVLRFASTFKRVAMFMVPFIFIELGVYIVLGIAISYWLAIIEGQGYQPSGFYDDIIRALWRALYFMGLSTGFWFYKRTIQKTREANELKIQKLESEKAYIATQIAYLKSQINPHFLFNSLNYIYNSVVRISPQASADIMLLSEIMRYSLNDSEPDSKVFLRDEIAHIGRYIQLMQLRFGNELFLNVSLPQGKYCDSCRIPPLMLLTFIENVFQHGDLSSPEDPAIIEITCSDCQLHLSTQNPKRRNRSGTGTNIGIQNVKTRLNLHYPQLAFELKNQETLTHYSVDLRMSL